MIDSIVAKLAGRDHGATPKVPGGVRRSDVGSREPPRAVANPAGRPPTAGTGTPIRRGQATGGAATVVPVVEVDVERVALDQLDPMLVVCEPDEELAVLEAQVHLELLPLGRQPRVEGEAPVEVAGTREPERAANIMKEHLETARLSLTRASET